MLFNKNNNGGAELVELLGFLDKATNFDRWRTWILLSVNQITGLVGKELYDRAEMHYISDNYKQENSVQDTSDTDDRIYTNSELDELVRLMQLANALTAYVKLLPSLDAGHSNSGRSRQLGTDVKALTAVEAYKDEANILKLSYDALEALVQYAEQMDFPEWKLSTGYKLLNDSIIQSRAQFDEYFVLNSARTFYTIVPIMRDVWRQDFQSVVNTELRAEMMEADKADTPDERQMKLKLILNDVARPALALGTMGKALLRLPIEVMPEGLVQTQIVGTVKEKKIATEESIKRMVTSLTADYRSLLNELTDELSALSGGAESVNVERPKEVGKGFRF